MAIVVFTAAPNKLLAEMRAGIDSGSVKTWTYDTDGDFTHTPSQWRNEAWLVPAVKTDRILFTILPPISVHLSREVYAVYHGRFIEMLLAHFDKAFDRVRVTALPQFGDIVKSQTE